MTELLEQAAYDKARHAIAALGMESGNLALGPDPTERCGASPS